MLCFLLDNHTTVEIAELLHLAPTTIKKHKANLMKTLRENGIGTEAAAIRLAKQEKMCQEQPTVTDVPLTTNK